MRLSYEELKGVVKSVIDNAGISVNSFEETRNNTVGLLDKIGKIVNLETEYQIDKLAEFDGEYLSFGKTIEEWASDLIMPVAYDENGSGALAPHKSTYRPVFYSYTIGRKVIPQTIYYNDIERAVHFENQFVRIIADKYKRISDSMAVYRYGLKREILAKFYDIAQSDDLGMTGADVEWDAAETTAWTTEVGTKAENGAVVLSVTDDNLVDDSYEGKYINVKVIPADSTKTLKELVEEGYLIKLNLVTELAIPVDDTTGEAFIKQVKEDVEIASDLSEGHSLNGNTLGANNGLVLILKQGVMPSLQVDTLSGAFQKEELAMPTKVIVIRDFGSAPNELYGMLVDARAVRLHPTFNGTFENLNGEGSFLNVFRHTEDTAYISRNAFVKFYCKPSA